VADPDQLSEAYHVLGMLREGQKQAEGELDELRTKADETHKDLMAQLEEAEQERDEAAISRIEPLIEQAQQAWVVANEGLKDADQADQPPPPDEEQDDGNGQEQQQQQ
jgi:hypothetical protein